MTDCPPAPCVRAIAGFMRVLAGVAPDKEPPADLRGADLRGADLRGSYLHGAYLPGADLRDSDLIVALKSRRYFPGAAAR